MAVPAVVEGEAVVVVSGALVAADGRELVDVAPDAWCFDAVQPARTMMNKASPASSARRERIIPSMMALGLPGCA